VTHPCGYEVCDGSSVVLCGKPATRFFYVNGYGTTFPVPNCEYHMRYIRMAFGGREERFEATEEEFLSSFGLIVSIMTA